jgi:hypothetical protein
VRSATIFNIISLIFLILTIVVLVVVGIRLAAPPPPEPVVILPTTVPDELFPSLTPTFTHTPTFTATFPPTFTPTFTVTASITPSLTPSNTPTITSTPTITLTASESPTPQPTPTATGPTPTLQPSLSPFIFGVPNGVTYEVNPYNTLGCAWQGVGGQVTDLAGQEIPAGKYQVRVFGNGFERVVGLGSNSFYGIFSGWEVQTDTTVNSNTYFVRLETINGTEISETIQVPFFTDCARNLARINFRQLREI